MAVALAGQQLYPESMSSHSSALASVAQSLLQPQDFKACVVESPLLPQPHVLLCGLYPRVLEKAVRHRVCPPLLLKR